MKAGAKRAEAPLLSVEVRRELDVVLARQRARQVAALLGLAAAEQTRLATAVSEIARNAARYAGGGRVELAVAPDAPALLLVRVEDRGGGIARLEEVLSGRYHSDTGLGLGIVGARRIVDLFEIESGPGGTRVTLGKLLPAGADASAPRLAELARAIARERPADAVSEIQLQNQELLRTLDELRVRTAELAQLNRELEETNRGVVALYSELDDKARQLGLASEAKTRFLSNMSHEFRTPVNTILSFCRMLTDEVDGPLGAEQRKQVGFIEKAAQGLSELVNDLLDLAKVEAGRQEARPAPFRAQDLLAGLRGTLRPLLAGAAVQLHFDDAVGLGELFTDEAKVSQILRNLVSNALKFTERGEVRVSATDCGDGRVRFDVSDTGIGVAPEDQERIFEEFTQVDSPLQRRVKGTGLGLPLSRSLAALLGGEVRVRSAPGEGSTFSLVLPRRFEPPARVAPVPAPAPAAPLDAGAGGPVLVIDDDEAARYLLRGVLERAGVRVLEAADGEQGLRLARTVGPRYVFLDLQMPGLSGFEVLERLQADSATRAIPVAVHTARPLDPSERGRLAGATVFLSKELPSRAAAAREILAALALPPPIARE